MPPIELPIALPIELPIALPSGLPIELPIELSIELPSGLPIELSFELPSELLIQLLIEFECLEDAFWTSFSSFPDPFWETFGCFLDAFGVPIRARDTQGSHFGDFLEFHQKRVLISNYYETPFCRVVTLLPTFWQFVFTCFFDSLIF